MSRLYTISSSGGTIPQGKSLRNYLHTFGIFLYIGCLKVQSYKHNQQTNRALSSLHLGKMLCYISEVYIVKFKVVYKPYSKEPQKSTSNQYALYSKYSCRIFKQHIHTILDER